MRQFSYRPAAVRPCRRPQASALPHAWKTTSVLLALFAAAPHLGGQNAGTHYAIVVGVSDYAHEGLGLLKFAREDAERFADQIRATHGAAVEQVSVLLDREATRTRLLDRLREILTIRARPGDSVFLFFSARGLTSTVSKRGFIMGYESSPERPPTGLQIEDLRRMIRQSDAEQVLLFADVCREPNPPTTRNLINSRLSELDSDPKVAGLLASQPKQVSQALPERERGAFGYYLVEGLKRPASVKNGLVAADLGPLYQYVHANVHRATARKQSPYLFGERSLTRGRQTWRGRAVAAYLPPRRQLHALERAGSDSASVSAVSYYPKSRRHSFWRLGLLGLLAQSAPPTPRQAFDRAIADGRLLGPRGAWEIYERNPASGFEVGDLNRLAIALEEQAQNVIARYGEGDQFPDDPQRPGKQQFADAAELFRLCTWVRQRWPDGLDEELRPSLRAREDFCRAKAMTFDSEFDAAAALLRRSLAANPNLPEPHNALGVVNLERGRHESAISQFEASLELAPDWAYARHNLALAHVERGDYAQAEQEYRTAIERTPYHPYLFYNLGVLLQRLNRKSEAEREYRRSLESYEELDEREAAKLAEWSEQGLAAEADRARTRRSVWKNNKAEVRNALGALFHARGKLGRAADEYRAAVDLRPAFGHAKYNLGLLEAEQARGDLDHPGFSRAIALWREVLELSPDHTAARLRLAESLALLGETGEATSQYEAILEALGQFRPARAGLLELRGDAQKREGRIDRACDAYSGALELAAGEQSEKRLSRKHKALCN